MVNKVRRITKKQAEKEIELNITDQSDILYVKHGKKWTNEKAAIVSNEFVDQRNGIDDDRRMQLFIAKSFIDSGFPGLTKKQKAVILRYLKGMTQKEIANELRISQPRISQTIKEVIPKLKKLIPEFQEE